MGFEGHAIQFLTHPLPIHKTFIRKKSSLIRRDYKMSENNKRSRVVVQIGEAKVELEGEHSNVKELMGNPLFEFIKGFQKSVGELPVPTTVAPEVEEETAKEFPPQLGKVDTMADALTELFKKPWGRQPRKLEDIMNVLEVNGLYYKKSAVSTQLVHMMRKQEIRRFGARRNYQYVAV